MAKGRIVAKTGISKKKGHMYYIDGNGDVRETMLAQYRKDRDRLTSQTMDGIKGKKTAKAKPAKKRAAPKKAAAARPAKSQAKKSQKKTA